ncbi:MAG: GGDEF domain-containing protein [Candidatus Izemoplasmatales bacterium]
MNEKLSHKLRLTLFAFVIIFILIVSIFFSTKNQRIITSDATPFNRGWEVYINDDFLRQVNLPEKIIADGHDQVKIKQVLNDDFDDKQIILLRGSLQEVLVKIDNQIIYQKDFEDNAFNTHASLYHFVTIPEDSDGKTIEIVFSTPYKNMSGTLNEIYYGSQSTLRDLLLNQHEFKLYVAVFLFMLSLIFTIAYAIVSKKLLTYQIYLGFFGVFIATWLFAESKIVQLFLNNDFLIGSLAYLSLATSLIAAASYLKYHIFDNKKNIYTYLCVIYSIHLLLITILHVFQVYAFFETVVVTLGLMTIGFFITLIILIIEYIHTKNNKYRNYIFILFLFSIFILLEIINFASNDFMQIAEFASTGIATVLIIIFMMNALNLFRKIKFSFEQQVYEEIANTDQLTRAGSRFAFEKDFDKMFYDSKKKISLVYFDFDDLKSINDEYGHIEGDITLVQGYLAIQEIFGGYGRCYRIGGDEFACLSEKLNERTYLRLKKELKELLKNILVDKPYTINVSIGYTSFNSNIDKKPSDLILRADKQMYLDKKSNKTQAK